MKPNKIPVRMLFGLLLLGGIGWLLYTNIEFYEETEASGWSIDALRNPYLAAQQFMRRSGIEVTDVDSLARLDELASVGTLFFSDANQVQSPSQLQQVMDWLNGGGNVIYSASSVASKDDLLLEEFEVGVEWADLETEGEGEDRSISETMREYNRQLEEGKTREEIARDLGGDDIALTRVRFSGAIGELDIAFDNGRILSQPYVADADYDAGRHKPFSWSQSDSGVHMLQFEIGSGLLTIVSDPNIWNSYQIDRYDHAYLLWLLSSQQGRFAILRSVVRESIWSLMRRNVSELLIAAGLLIFAWIWHLGYRFGRMLPRDLSRRRALGEYFTSVSHYLWHRHHGRSLLHPLRQQVLRRAGRALPEFARADPARRHELIAARCELNAETISRAFGDQVFTEASFVRTVRLLKRIEQSL